MTITEEMRQIIDLIENTDEALYITGKAGTGKTTLLKYIVETIHKRFIIAAPTGIAAINAGGVTLHSFLNIPFGVLGPESAKTSKYSPNKSMLANTIDALIIDEISMVRADVMDFVDKKLRIYRHCDLPFGGVQIIMFGDCHQLPPVVKPDERNVLQGYYPGPYFFNASVWLERGFKVMELTHIFRQSDEHFIRILNNIREYRMTPDDIAALEEIRDKSLSRNFDGKYIHICSHKEDVAHINAELLGEPSHSFRATFDGDFNPISAPCDETLLIRVGARVMTLVNDKERRYYNGSLGNVISIEDEKINVKLDNNEIVAIAPYSWEQIEYKTVEVEENGEVTKKIDKVVKGTCKQYPLTLAWAITIHKSQGLTFDNIVIHSQRMFCPGQLYVALSRCTSLEGIASDSFISQRMILPDYELSSFEKAYKANGNIFDCVAYKSMFYEGDLY